MFSKDKEYSSKKVVPLRRLSFSYVTHGLQTHPVNFDVIMELSSHSSTTAHMPEGKTWEQRCCASGQIWFMQWSWCAKAFARDILRRFPSACGWVEKTRENRTAGSKGFGSATAGLPSVSDATTSSSQVEALPVLDQSVRASGSATFQVLLSNWRRNALTTLQELPAGRVFKLGGSAVSTCWEGSWTHHLSALYEQ